MANSIFSRRPAPEPEAITASGLAPAAAVGYNSHRALTASAARINLKSKKELDAISKRRQTELWQSHAWEYYDLIGEIKYAANLVASTTSRVNLYAGYVKKSADVPQEINMLEDDLDPDFIKDTEDILYLLESGNGGTAGLLRTAALNLFVAGECWLVREPSRFSTGEPDRYQIRSVDEIIAVQGRKARLAIKPSKDAKPSDYIYLPDGTFVSRIWRNHPRYSEDADSSLRGVLEPSDQLLLLDRASAAAAKSRLNAGLIFLPDGLANAAESDDEMVDDEFTLAAQEEFEDTFIQGIIGPVEDSDSAGTVVPTIIRGPEDLGEKIKYISFERASDPQHNARADRLLERILGGLDIPKDVAAGMSSVKYSNAIIIEEQLYKAHIEPLILMICDALTIGFLRPALRAQGWDEKLVSRAVVWYDPTAITAKPSKAEAALTLYGLKIIGADAVRRANGFGPADAPTELERVQRMAEERAIISDGLSETLLDTMLPEELKAAAREQALSNSDPESADALNNALGGEPLPGEEQTTPNEETPGEEAPSNDGPQAPPTLMEP